MNHEPLKSFHVEATAICHIDFGNIEAQDDSKMSQLIMLKAAKLGLKAEGVKNISLVVTEVHSEEMA